MPVDVSNMVATQLMAKQQQKQAAEAAQQQQLAAQLLEQQRYDQERKDKREQVEFDRNFKMAEMEAKTATELGTGRKHFYNDPRIEAVAKFGEAQGLLKRHNDEIARKQQLNDERVKHERLLAKLKQEHVNAVDLAGVNGEITFQNQTEKTAQEQANAVVLQDDQQAFVGSEGKATRSNAKSIASAHDANAYAIALLNAQRQHEGQIPTGNSRADRIDIRKLGEDLSPYGNLQGAVAKVNETLGIKGDKPGVGMFDSWRAAFGYGPSAGIESRQATQHLFNAYLAAVSGKAVTPSEADRTNIETGMKPGASEEAWALGMDALIRNVQLAMQNIEAGTDPALVDIYRQRGGVTSRDVATPRAPLAPPPPGKIRIVNTQTGKTKVGPEGAELEAWLALHPEWRRQ